MTWTERKTVVYDIDKLPFNNDGELNISDPSVVTVNVYGLIHPADIGAWCYIKRKKTHFQKGFITLVDQDSFRSERMDFVSRYLESINNHILTGKSPKSLKSVVFHFYSFVQWCDTYNPKYLDNKETIPTAVEGFSNDLLHDAKINRINVNSAASKQLVIISTLKRMYNDTYGDLFEGVRKIHRSRKAAVATVPPSDNNAQKSYLIIKSIFYQFTDFLTTNAPYPVKIDIPGKSYWIFPNRTSHAQKLKVTSGGNICSLMSYNHDEGRLNTHTEILKQIQKNKYILPSGIDKKANYAKISLQLATNNINSANSNPYHPRRIRNATLAQLSFIMLFAANTGMSLAQISELYWTDKDYDIENSHQGFKGIKQRAKGRLVSFIVSSSFVPIFKKYLSLRKYLLGACAKQTTNYLFFRICKDEIRQIHPSTSNHFRDYLYDQLGIDISITTRQWRAYKSNYLIKTSGIAVAAQLLQNSPNTVIKHYMAGSETQASEEFTSYFNNFTTRLIDSTKNSETISTGQCTLINNPETQYDTPPFIPDCKKPEGCLFCKHHAVHADLIDLKKILSFKYVIEQTRHLSASNEHYHKLFDPVFTQITNAITAIIKSPLISHKSYINLKKDIYHNEHLDEYWGMKLQLLVDLEAL